MKKSAKSKIKHKKSDGKTHQTKEDFDWKDKYIRALADYQNLEKRVSGERKRLEYLALKKIMTDFFVIYDTLQIVQKNTDSQGLDLLIKQCDDLFKKNSIEKTDVINKKFDPNLMECIELVNGRPGIVEEEIQKGYTTSGEVLKIA